MRPAAASVSYQAQKAGASGRDSRAGASWMSGLGSRKISLEHSTDGKWVSMNDLTKWLPDRCVESRSLAFIFLGTNTFLPVMSAFRGKTLPLKQKKNGLSEESPFTPRTATYTITLSDRS